MKKGKGGICKDPPVLTEPICGMVMKECKPEEHKWLYYNYERYCRVCERIEPYKDKLAKAVNPVEKKG